MTKKSKEIVSSSTSKSVTNKTKRFDWSKILMKDRFFGKTHPHTREKERRLKQIQRGILKVDTGGVA